MSDFKLTILGSGSAMPTPERFSSAHVLNVHGHLYLIDCGEGAQIAMKKYNIKMNKIEAIFISHLHGDHYFGLIGLLNSMHLNNRKKELNLYCFKPLDDIIKLQIEAANTQLSYKIKYNYLSEEGLVKLFDSKHVEVFSFPLIHRIPCCGFLFKEKKQSRNIKKEFVKNHNIPKEWFPKILSGQDFIDENGNVFSNNEIVNFQLNPRSYAYCSDTAYDEKVADYCMGVKLLYHEASFADDLEDVAKEKFHSTASQAALIARKSKAETLIIGHFSNRYKDKSLLINQAKQIFESTIEAYDGKVFEL